MPYPVCIVRQAMRAGNLGKLDALLREFSPQDEELICAGMMDAATQCLPDQLLVFLRYCADAEHVTRCFQQTVRFAILTTKPPMDRLMETLLILVHAGADINKPLFKPVNESTSTRVCLSILGISEKDILIQ